jgi:hypothetical protein
MDNLVNIHLFTGLGDKLLDLIGFFILCKHMNYKSNITFNNGNVFAWGNNNYDMRLFDFNGVSFLNEKCNFYVYSPNPSSSLCPYKVYSHLKKFLPELTFEQISNDFITYSKQIINPSEIIMSNIPNDIENSYGIHLRKSDKVSINGDIRHENLPSEFEVIINKLLEDVKNIIANEKDPKFVIVSEDDNWKLEIKTIIIEFAKNNNKNIQILDIDYTNENNYSNYKSVLDMFCLSRCKEILQGVKYSTFSILGSLIGNGKIRNYSNYTDSYDVCLIHSWSSVIQINNNKNFDIEFHKKITSSVNDIHTNISKIYG